MFNPLFLSIGETYFPNLLTSVCKIFSLFLQENFSKKEPIRLTFTYWMEYFFSMKRYLPLWVLILVAALAALALGTDGMLWLRYFMGLFFCQFAMLKLFNLPQFANGFQMYDLVAKKSRFYALLYPFIELGLGLAYLAGIGPIATPWITIGVMGIGAIGVFRALKIGLDVRCACMGTILDVPLSTVTLTEDLGMIAMAAIMLITMY